MLILRLFWLLAFSSILCHCESCTEENCQLPSCQCSIRNGNPTLLDDNELPQFILLTFVGNLSKHSLEPIRSILNSSYRNPNKCPISSTFFIHDTDTDYCLVQRLFGNHHEIAMTTSSNKCPLNNCYNESSWHRWTTDDWHEEIKNQRRHIVEYAQIHQSHIKGFRVPHLQIDQNKHFDFLHQYNFHYDSSMLFKSSNLMWPFTLDYAFDQTDCTNCQQLIKPVQALWQFPLHEWAYPKTKKSCRTLFDSSCLPAKKSHTVDFYVRFLKYNFERHSSLSTGYRSPFIIQLDLSQLSQPNSVHLQAMIEFMEYILSSRTHRYVYFISIEKALEWLKYPRGLSELHDFWAFGCDKKIYDYDNDCSTARFDENEDQIITSSKSGNVIKTNLSETFELQGEKLFPNDIVFHALWIFLLMIMGVFFYDKYFTNK